jgi:hypothetical protein
MNQDRKKLVSAFVNLNMDNADTLVPHSNEELQRLNKNITVYDDNIDILGRYNAETNLNEYAARRKQYTTEVGKYKQEFSRWKEQQSSAAYLYNQQTVLNNYNKNLKVENSQLAAVR